MYIRHVQFYQGRSKKKKEEEEDESNTNQAVKNRKERERVSVWGVCLKCLKKREFKKRQPCEFDGAQAKKSLSLPSLSSFRSAPGQSWVSSRSARVHQFPRRLQ
ncbi:hypothetical protein AA313_de0200762 [Arthrobotrys entomopaga]|nr:hypothetical protein AA313_de0200762 [Arthrobotrys entomopaga]